MTEEYYVYAYLREDGTPYYIGKGKGDRAYSGKKRRFKVPPRDRILIVLQNLTEEQAFSNEKDFIAWYGRKDNGTGILRNLTDGGDGPSGYRHTEESKNAIREKRKNQVITVEHKKALSESLKRGYEDGSIKKSMLGKHHTEEHKEYMRKLYTGRVMSEEQKKQISIANKGRKHSPEYGRRISEMQKGKKASEETKQKMSEMHKKRWSTIDDNNKKMIGKKISERNKGKIRTEEYKSNLSKWFMGSIYINNGIENRRIQKGVDIPDGWVKGRLSYKKWGKVGGSSKSGVSGVVEAVG
jgi:ribosomal protein S17